MGGFGGGGSGGGGADGLSAYQIAVLEGFVGTQAAWIASLKGDAGQGVLFLAAGASLPGGLPDNTMIVRVPL